MKHGKLDKIFEEQEKLIKVKLSSDPVKKDKSYEGYLVNETPKAELKMEGLLNTIGKAQNWISEKKTKSGPPLKQRKIIRRKPSS